MSGSRNAVDKFIFIPIEIFLPRLYVLCDFAFFNSESADVILFMCVSRYLSSCDVAHEQN